MFQPLSLFALCAVGGLQVTGSASVCEAPPKALAREDMLFQGNVQAPIQQMDKDPSGERDAAAAASARGHLATECKSYPGQRVVLVTVNAEFLEMFGNWLRFARPFLQSTEHLHVIAEEAGAVAPLRELLKESGVEFTLDDPTPKQLAL